MHVTLIVPGLLALPAEALAQVRALRTLARYAGAPAIERGGVLAALAAACRLPPGAPLAPLLAAGAGFDAGGDFVLAADPVTLVAGRVDVVLIGRVDDLDREEAGALIDALSRHFAADGLRFAAPRPDAWFAHGGLDPALVTTSTDAAQGAPMFAHLPQGRDGKTWQRWQTEIQMLLFEHPVNEARERRGLAPVTGVWFWGGGRSTAVPAEVNAFAAGGRVGDLARGLALCVGHPAEGVPPAFKDMLARMPQASMHALVVLSQLPGVAALQGFETAWIAPAIAALEGGRIESFALIADGGGTCACWRASRPSPLARLAAHFRAPAFALPGAESE